MSNDRFYAACLASYNNGVLHGVWVDASTDVDDMQATIAKMLRESKFPNIMVPAPELVNDGTPQQGWTPSAEEWAIHDYDSLWLRDLGEYPGLATIAKRMELAEAMETEFGGEALELHDAYVNHYGSHYVQNDGAADVVERIRDAYRGTYRTREDWAAEWCDECGYLDQVPEALRHYIDFDSFARDAEISGDIDFEPGGDGVLVFMWS